MRKMLFSLAAASLFVSGCASVGSDYQSNVDFAKVNRVENAARAVGVQVYWVNYPVKASSSLN